MQAMVAADFIKHLTKVFQTDNLFTEPADCWPYGYDNSRHHHCPDVVVMPETHQQVVDCVLLCNQFQTPLTARGRGTGTTGAAVPVRGGLVMSLERMQQILDFNPGDGRVRVAAGVTNLALQEFLKEKHFFWPPDPGSAEFCSIGGNLACNAAGPRAVKYGATRDNTLQLKAVTGSGKTIVTGCKTTKGVVGLDLTRLLIGSEGTLAVITEAELKILPLAPRVNTMQALYSSHRAACAAIQALNAQLHAPCAIEFIDHHAIDLIRHHSEVDLPGAARAMLMVEMDGDDELLGISVPKARQALSHRQLIAIKHADAQQDRQALWQARKALSPILRHLAPNKINEDVVVPLSKLSRLIDATDQLSIQHDIRIVNFGHAGNGNLHVNILYDAGDRRQNQSARQCLLALFKIVLQLDGSLSGEHGVGLVKRDYIADEIGINELLLMQQIKKQFDPGQILNPDKTLPTLRPVNAQGCPL